MSDGLRKLYRNRRRFPYDTVGAQLKQFPGHYRTHLVLIFISITVSIVLQFRHTEKTMSIGDFNIKLRSSEPWGAKICGNMNALRVDGYRDDYESNNSVAGDDELLQNSFVDHRGLIEFRIYLRNKTLDDDEELNFEIVFTPFRGEYKITR